MILTRAVVVVPSPEEPVVAKDLAPTLLEAVIPLDQLATKWQGTHALNRWNAVSPTLLSCAPSASRQCRSMAGPSVIRNSQCVSSPPVPAHCRATHDSTASKPRRDAGSWAAGGIARRGAVRLGARSAGGFVPACWESHWTCDENVSLMGSGAASEEPGSQAAARAAQGSSRVACAGSARNARRAGGRGRPAR
jgi:hypothetical protein